MTEQEKREYCRQKTRERSEMRIMNHECVECGKKLDPIEDVSIMTGELTRKCILCRIRLKIGRSMGKERKEELIEKCREDQELRRRIMGICVRCGGHVSRMDVGHNGYCLTCSAEIDPESVPVVKQRVRMHRGCGGCEWRKYHGDGIYSCPGTGSPEDMTCLKYEKENLRREANGMDIHSDRNQ